MDKFELFIKPSGDDCLLDVGGYPGTWTTRLQKTKKIECLNIHSVNWDPKMYPDYCISTTVGDGCNLEYKDASYEILFSNSVIEHVGDFEKQKDFAKEVRRVGQRIWIQTPAFECPLEPHYLAPFVHWLPIKVRRKILRWFTPWGWISKPSQEKIDETIAYTQLLTKKQVVELFPDCEIITERLLGVFPKSYVAYRAEG